MSLLRVATHLTLLHNPLPIPRSCGYSCSLLYDCWKRWGPSVTFSHSSFQDCVHLAVLGPAPLHKNHPSAADFFPLALPFPLYSFFFPAIVCPRFSLSRPLIVSTILSSPPPLHPHNRHNVRYQRRPQVRNFPVHRKRAQSQQAHRQLLIRSHSPSLLARVTPTRSPIRSLMPSSMPACLRTPSPRLLARPPPRLA